MTQEQKDRLYARNTGRCEGCPADIFWGRDEHHAHTYSGARLAIHRDAGFIDTGDDRPDDEWHVVCRDVALWAIQKARRIREAATKKAEKFPSIKQERWYQRIFPELKLTRLRPHRKAG